MNRLTAKQQKFIDEYLVCKNATKAARAAGYAGDGNALGVIGHKLLRNTKILAEISRRLADSAMQANEVIARLSQMAGGDIGDFLIFGEGGRLDLNLVTTPTHIIKRFRRRRRVRVTENYTEETEYISIELHDAQDALFTLLRYHGLQRDNAQPTPSTPLDTTRLTSDERRILFELLEKALPYTAHN